MGLFYWDTIYVLYSLCSLKSAVFPAGLAFLGIIYVLAEKHSAFYFGDNRRDVCLVAGKGASSWLCYIGQE